MGISSYKNPKNSNVSVSIEHKTISSAEKFYVQAEELKKENKYKESIENYLKVKQDGIITNNENNRLKRGLLWKKYFRITMVNSNVSPTNASIAVVSVGKLALIKNH